MSLDAARPVRAGEELDRARVAEYLRGALGGDGPLEIEQFPGGHSNLTYLLRWGDRELVLRRPPFGSKVKTAHDMGREHRVLSALSTAYDKAPRPVALCDDESVIGVRFYVMERLRGFVLRKDPPQDMTWSPPIARRLCEVLIDTLAELHAIDYRAIGLADFGKPAGYVTRQVSGWTERYRASRTDDIPDLERAGAWLAANLPPSTDASLIHNDFKFDNLVLDPADITRVVGILDWEMATLGDPLMDLGTALAYWVEENDPPLLATFRFGPTNYPGMMTRAELVRRYQERTGRDTSGILFYYCFGLFKTAVVLQQIYYRYHQGHTSDARFASMIDGVRLLAAMAAAALDRGRM